MSRRPRADDASDPAESDAGEDAYFAVRPEAAPRVLSGLRLSGLRTLLVVSAGVVVWALAGGDPRLRGALSVLGTGLITVCGWLARERRDALPPRLTLVGGDGLYALPYAYPAVVVGWVLLPTFFLGGVRDWIVGAVQPDSAWRMVLVVAATGTAAVLTVFGAVQAVSAWLGRPRPYAGLTPAGLVLGTPVGSVRVAWDRFGPEQPHYLHGTVAFPIYDRAAVRVRGFVAGSVLLPDRDGSGGQPLTVSARWNTNPRVVAVGVGRCRRDGALQRRLGTAAAHRSIWSAASSNRVENPWHW
ncbi:hypothetical protein [Cryptosporangium minutisporangium]|uniref:Uncharacterized protein n=1 Tax=Cryptosporangium minutisporangium TaxID=113569 RepID=A0ABP6SQN8_9ACTN